MPERKLREASPTEDSTFYLTYVLPALINILKIQSNSDYTKQLSFFKTKRKHIRMDVLLLGLVDYMELVTSSSFAEGKFQS